MSERPSSIPEWTRENVEKLVKAKLSSWEFNDFYEFAYGELVDDYLSPFNEFEEDWLFYFGDEE